MCVCSSAVRILFMVDSPLMTVSHVVYVMHTSYSKQYGYAFRMSSTAAVYACRMRGENLLPERGGYRLCGTTSNMLSDAQVIM